MTHGRPTIEDLAASASGELSPAAASAIEAAAARHAEDAASLRGMRGIVDTLRSDDGTLPPAESVARTKATLAALGRRQALAPEGITRWWQLALQAVDRLTARLIFDSAQPEHALGVRDASALAGGELTSTRHLAFQREGVEVDLQFESGTFEGHPARCQIIGQISRTDGDGGPCTDVPVALVCTATGVVVEVATDATGVFVASVDPGRYDLIVGGPEATVLPAIQVR